MSEYRGKVVHIYRPPPKIHTAFNERSISEPRPATVTVQLDTGGKRRFREPTGVRLKMGDRIVVDADLEPGGWIGSLRKDG